ncbi:hypothetical protein [Streptomyces sp. NPDC000961]|uniref:hypothetical protein n=1 Tax=Streptomyces sp. NPDC000961 TaxID=3364541 RepID=UPI003695291A
MTAGRGISQTPNPNSEYRKRVNAGWERDARRRAEDVAASKEAGALNRAEKATAWSQMMASLNDPGSRYPGEPR